MGQKVSPVGLRVGIIRDWEARWYADKNDVADLLHEDLKIRELLEDFYRNAAVSRIDGGDFCPGAQTPPLIVNQHPSAVYKKWPFNAPCVPVHSDAKPSFLVA